MNIHLIKDICPGTMLRTNSSFLAYIRQLYEQQDTGNGISIKSFSTGQLLLQQGRNYPGILLVSEGITKCFITEENDKEYIVEFLGSGEITGEIEAIRNMPCLCNVQALTDVSVFFLPKMTFYELLKKDLRFNNLLIEALTERIVNTSSRASFQQLYTIEHSLSKLLELQSKLNLNLSKDDMASYLGITIRSLNRALESLKQ